MPTDLEPAAPTEQPELYECKCCVCNFAGVWVSAATLKRQPVIRCGRGHTLSVIVPAGVSPPKLKLAKAA